MFRGASIATVSKDNPYSKQGVEIISLSENGEAWTAGLRNSDVIVEVNRQPTPNLQAFNAMTSRDAGDSSDRVLALTVIREGRKLLLFLP